MGHAPHPTQSLVNSCEEFYQAKQLFSLTHGNWHVLAQLQKASPVPKCKNILRIAKKKLQKGQSSNKICSLIRGKIYLCSQTHSSQAHLLQVCFCECSVWRAPIEGTGSTGTEKSSSAEWRPFAPAEDSIQSTYKMRLECCVPLQAKWEAVSLLVYFSLGILASAISIKLILVWNNPLAWQGLNMANQKGLPRQHFVVATVWR